MFVFQNLTWTWLGLVKALPPLLRARNKLKLKLKLSAPSLG